MKSRIVKVCLLLFVFVAIAIIMIGISANRFLTTPVQPTGEQLLEIKSGMAFTRIARALEAQQVISNADHFVLLARWQGQTGAVHAGSYRFIDPATPATVLQRLVKGDVRKFQVTIPEGLNLKEIAQRVEEAGVARADAFIRLTTDPEFASRHGVDAETLEGYLFPETYTVQSETTLELFIDAMLAQFEREVTPGMLQAASELGLDRHQLVTLASIIQKEAGNNSEMPLISAVFHNRLRGKIPLQADPTVIYGVKNFDGNLTRKHLETPTPYNTYRKRGLPPGPIASPGRDALNAATQPADVNYLYFVARGDGTHEFNATLREHNKAVRRFQLRR